MLDNIRIRKFERGDWETILWWLESREIGYDTSEHPDAGLVATVDSVPVACLFIRVCDKMGIIEGLTTDPMASSKIRSRAMDDLIVFAMSESKFLGLKTVIAYSIDENVINRAETLGFVKQPHTLICYHTGV